MPQPGRECRRRRGAAASASKRKRLASLGDEFRRLRAVPEVSPEKVVHVSDDRERRNPDEDLIEIGITMESCGRVAVSLSRDELLELRDALTRVIERPLN